ncbi:hypothetical protein PF007_g19667 [Phytophthora fragariae]|uniref:Uncharacterized protein n=1 Tax=Phytophthora fragariae TaxID=53985 RepID=A0A6A3R4K7_9STRA|nr:hypothetical protein PF009_g20533 [Phytophthora fragariae]KAE9089249.1 hypothetical protein PF007_g19667 [Phytophthora fragariae]KAE9118725.1 hypothetical protein PF006_g18522 [Phytophthora fragariae]
MDEMTHQYDVKLKQHILDWLAGKALLSRVDDVDEMTHQYDVKPKQHDSTRTSVSTLPWSLATCHRSLHDHRPTALLMDFIQIIKSLVGKKNKINILLEKHSSVLPTSANISMTDHPGRYKLMILLEKTSTSVLIQSADVHRTKREPRWHYWTRTTSSALRSSCTRASTRNQMATWIDEDIVDAPMISCVGLKKRTGVCWWQRGGVERPASNATWGKASLGIGAVLSFLGDADNRRQERHGAKDDDDEAAAGPVQDGA